jgi:TPP-dependent trihydroxycyclohexane-1,2-dione (THcHDO) dehydratase
MMACTTSIGPGATNRDGGRDRTSMARCVLPGDIFISRA